MILQKNIQVPVPEIASFCRRNHIRKLAFFGSVLRSDFRPDSDIDVLVEFEPGHVPGFIRLFGMEEELSAILGGRKVDMVTEKFLNRRIRDKVLANLEVQYVQG
jgi:predicted nucleotidyltransferase